MRKIVVKDRQSIFDIAVQEYGSVDGVVQLMNDNPDVITHLTMPLVSGTKLKIISPAINQAVVDFHKTNDLKPANAPAVSAIPPPTGYLLNEDGSRILQEIPLAPDDSSYNTLIE